MLRWKEATDSPGSPVEGGQRVKKVAAATILRRYFAGSWLVDNRGQSIREAQHLLRTTNWTINRIAEETGHLSASSFCRAFRRNTGQNTSTYKALAEMHGSKEES